MLTEKPAPTAEQIAKAAKIRANAAASRERAEESFRRCDTDGFLSQWANQIGAQKDEAQAVILDNGGYAQFPVLCDAEGSVVADRIHKFANKFATWKTTQSWRLPDDLAAKLGRKWVPVSGYSHKSRVQAALGLHEESRWFPAYAAITTGGAKSTGLGGCANAYVSTFKEGESPD
jgi:hypothetical protein